MALAAAAVAATRRVTCRLLARPHPAGPCPNWYHVTTRSISNSSSSSDTGRGHLPPPADDLTAGLSVYYSDAFTVALPEGHRFPMERYAATAATLRSVVASLPPGATGRALVLREPPRASRDALCLAHDAGYVDAFLDGSLPEAAMRDIGFPWSPAFVTRTLAITGGTLAATADALAAWRPRGGGGVGRGIACVAAGGTHHAWADHGEGFCVVNDIAIAARAALAAGAETGVRRVVVLDLDVHQGNGTAAILAADAPHAITLSIHGARNYPWATRAPSTLDVDLPDGTGDDAYLAALTAALADVDARLPGPHTDVLAFFQAGVDPLAEDRLGRLALTRTGLRARNAAVYAWAEARGVPLVVTMGGGYARPISASARAHADVFLQAAASWTRRRAAADAGLP